MPKPKANSLEEKIAIAKEHAVVWAEQLYHYKLVARAVGYTDETIKDWRDADPEFSHQIQEARTRFLHTRITAAKPEFVLERLEPEIFKDRSDKNINIVMPTPILGGASTKQVEAEVKKIEAKE